MKRTILLVLFLATAITTSSVWSADDYPNKPIQLVSPFPPGGPIDLSARVVAEKMGEFLGQAVVMANKPGGGTAIATGYVAGSKPDGYTLFVTPAATLIFLPLITPNVPYSVSDFVPVGRLVSFNFLMLVNKDLPVRTLPELVAYIKKSPGKLSYGGSTFGSLQHLIGELFKNTAQVDLQFIPFAGENPAITALLGNHIQVGILTVFQQPHVRSNAVRAVSVLSGKRDPILPQIPTAVEQGFPDLSITAGCNLFLAPVKTPAPVVKKLEEALEKALHDKTVREKLEKMELTVDFLNSRNTQLFLENEVKKWTPVVKEAKIVVK